MNGEVGRGEIRHLIVASEGGRNLESVALERAELHPCPPARIHNGKTEPLFRVIPHVQDLSEMLSIACNLSALTGSDIQMPNGFVFRDDEDVAEAIHQPQSELRRQRWNPVAKEATPVFAILGDQVVVNVHPRTNITK